MNARGAGAVVLAVAVLALALTLVALSALSPAPAAAGADAAASSAPGERPGPRQWKPGVKAAKRYAKRRAGEVRFAIVAPNGKTHDLRGGSTVVSASVIKAMFLVAYLRKHRDDAISESARSTLRAMITRSDNGAADEIQAAVGLRRVDRLARRARMKHFRQSSTWGLSRIASGDMARFMFRLERYVPKRHEGYAKNLLGDIVPSQRWGVGQAQPKGWRLMFKGGWGVGPGSVENQIARFERGRHRIGLAVLTNYGPSAAYKRATIRGVTRRLLRGLPR